MKVIKYASTMISIIIGTNRKDASSSRIAAIYLTLLKEAGTVVNMINLAEVTSATFHNLEFDPTFQVIQQQVNASNKFIFIVPEYNGSFPGILKVFIDKLEWRHSFRDKKCAIVGISSGSFGAGLALSHLTDIVNYMGMHALAYKPRLAKIEDHLKEYLSSDYENKLRKQVAQFIDF